MFKARPIIILTTDFGRQDGYPAAMKGVILGICPDVQIVDVSHDIKPQQVNQAAFVIASVAPYYPRGTAHLAVVDPGVGTNRRPLLVVTPEYACIGPDNGIFSMLLSAVEDQSEIEYYLLDREEYWRHPVSNTFHGRDIFAPVAGHLASGVRPEELGSPLSQIETLSLPATRTEGGKTFGVVIYIDNFGNLITNIRIDNPLQNVEVEISGHIVRGLSTAYAESRGLLAIVGSHGYLEIAWNRDSAAKHTGAKIGAPVVVRRLQL
jgi:S-adenosylmethionine hydrolase